MINSAVKKRRAESFRCDCTKVGPPHRGVKLSPQRLFQRESFSEQPQPKPGCWKPCKFLMPSCEHAIHHAEPSRAVLSSLSSRASRTRETQVECLKITPNFSSAGRRTLSTASERRRSRRMWQRTQRLGSGASMCRREEKGIPVTNYLAFASVASHRQGLVGSRDGPSGVQVRRPPETMRHGTDLNG